MHYALELDQDRNPECRHMPLVVAIAREFSWARRVPGIEHDDLIHIGWLAIKAAAKGYDPAHHTREAAYICRCIRNAFRKAISLAMYQHHVPPAVARAVRKLNRGEEIPLSAKKKANLAVASQRLKIRRKDLSFAIDQPGVKPDHQWIDREAIHLALEKLPEKDATIIRLHYGLDGEAMTFQAIADSGILGKVCSRQAVHARHDRVAERLRNLLGS